MILWLLSHLSTLQLVLLLVGGPTLLAVGACLAVQRAFPDLHELEFDKGSEALRGGFTVLFGLVLGLVIAGVSAQLAAARATVSLEATTLAEMVHASRGMAPGNQAAIDAALAEYVHAVADDEWVTMRQGRESLRAAAAFEQLYATYTVYAPPPDPFGSMSKLDQLTQARRTRLQQASLGSSLPFLLRILLSVGVVVFIAAWYPVNVSNKRTQVVVVASVAAFISFAYLLTIVLDFPFSGDISVGNEPFKEGVLASLWPSSGEDSLLLADAPTTSYQRTVQLH
jgi:hypothetical protein